MNFTESASWLFVTSTISKSGYLVARGSSWRHAWARVGESVGTITETRGQRATFKRARLAVGYSRISAGKFRRYMASVSAARFVRRAPGFSPLDPEAGGSRQWLRKWGMCWIDRARSVARNAES